MSPCTKPARWVRSSFRLQHRWRTTRTRWWPDGGRIFARIPSPSLSGTFSTKQREHGNRPYPVSFPGMECRYPGRRSAPLATTAPSGKWVSCSTGGVATAREAVNPHPTYAGCVLVHLFNVPADLWSTAGCAAPLDGHLALLAGDSSPGQARTLPTMAHPAQTAHKGASWHSTPSPPRRYRAFTLA